MLLLGASPSDRGILAATLAVAGAAIMALTSGYPDSVGRLLSDAPAAIDGAQAATPSAPVPAPASARRKTDVPAPATSSTVGDQRGLALYFLIEAARPLPLFGR
jgi:hypothetical protein